MLSAALSASALVAIQSFKQQKDDIKEADVRDNVEQVHNMVYAILQNRNHCLRTINDSKPSGLTIVPNEVRDIPFISMADSPNPAFVVGATNRYLTGTVSINRLQLVLPADLKNLATLNIVYGRHGNKRTGDSDVVNRSIRLSLTRSAPNMLSSCTSVTVDDGLAMGEDGNENLSKEICENFQMMTWDPDLRKCKLKENLCPTRTIFAGLDTDGNKICRPFMEYLPYLVETSFTQSCPDDYNLIKINRTLTNPFKISVECNKRNATCPSSHRVTWRGNATDSPLECAGQLPRGQDGQTYIATDTFTSSGNLAMGQASYECDRGTWRINNVTKVCQAPCPAGVRTWTEGSSNCEAFLPLTQHTFRHDVTDETLPTTGTSRWTCNAGNWERASGFTCTSPCSAASIGWTVSGASCTGPVPALLDGENVDITATNAPATGAARVNCNNGRLTVLSSPKSCVVPPEPGRCKWEREIRWENSGCTGFQVQEISNTTSTIRVTNRAQCTNHCTTCAGSSTYEVCTFIPD